MKHGARTLTAVAGLCAALSACVSIPEKPQPPPQNQPYVKLSSQEAARYQALAKEYEATLAGCTKHGCDRAHYTLGLIALAQSRQHAAGHFQLVAGQQPQGPLAAASQLWLTVLKAPAPTDQDRSGVALQQMIGTLVKDYLDREVSMQHILKEQRAAAQTLQQELTARDDRIKELSGQLEALKQIDDDIRTKTRPTAPRLRPPHSP